MPSGSVPCTDARYERGARWLLCGGLECVGGQEYLVAHDEQCIRTRRCATRALMALPAYRLRRQNIAPVFPKPKRFAHTLKAGYQYYLCQMRCTIDTSSSKEDRQDAEACHNLRTRLL